MNWGWRYNLKKKKNHRKEERLLNQLRDNYLMPSVAGENASWKKVLTLNWYINILYDVRQEW